MNTNYNEIRKLVNRYKKSGLQPNNFNNSHDKGETLLQYTKNQIKKPTPPLRQDEKHSSALDLGLGSLVKKNLNSVLQKKYPNNRYKGLFDGIDDKAVEKNLTLADDVIAKNSANPYNKELFSKLPNLRGGLATYYAAAASGNYKAADMARKLAYTEGDSMLLSAEPNESKQINTSNKRYVKPDAGLNLRSKPGTDTEIIGKLRKGDEVEFTGNKTGKIGNHEWAEIKYGEKIGWVAADYLNTEMPYDMYVPDKTNKRQSEIPQQEKTNAQTTNKGAGTRYIGEKEISMRDAPGFVGKPIGDAYYGESVEYTGNKKKVDGLDWAEIKYGNETRWILANCLKTAISDSVIDKNVPKGMIVNQSMGSEDRTKHLNEKMPEWMTEKGDYPTKYDMIEWYKNNGANVRYTGTYCLPIKMNVARISQGFYGTYSHAGKLGYEDSGNCGAVDIAAEKGTPVYSVLGGKVVYTYKEASKADMHRVTVETTINGEIYYIEYLHMDKVNVEAGQTLHIGTPIGTVGGWGSYSDGAFPNHLDFRVYKFTNENDKSFSSDGAKQFFDPFEFFDFDIQYKPKTGIIDYN